MISVLTFVIFLKLPAGDPARRLAGRQPTEEKLEAIRETYGLNEPFWVQYAKFGSGFIPWPGLFLNEEIYFSWSNNVPVKSEILEAFPFTAILALGATILWLLMGIPTGSSPRCDGDRGPIEPR